jgi:LysM repeat protein
MNLKYPNKQIRHNKKGTNGLVKIFVDLALSFFKLSSVLGTLLSGFFVIFFYRPGRLFLRFFFYKVAVKVYSLYLRTAKRLGLTKIQDKFWIVLNQKFVHLMVIIMTITLLFVNVNSKARASASGFNDNVQKTILADLVTGELGGFEVDEQLIVETFDQEAIISSTQQSYLENLSGFRSQQKVSFEEGEESEDAILGPMVGSEGTIVRQDSVETNITEQERTVAITYTVLAGDTISTIAEKFKISVSTILWENNLNAYSIIRPDDKLVILPTSGLNHKVEKNETISSIAKKYGVDETKILEANKLAKGESLKIGQKLLLPGGKKPAYVAPAPTTYTGIAAIKNIVKTPSAKAVEPGNKMTWPTDGHRITQYYSWRHYGLDVANKIGTPIYAADSGTVELVGWGNGYGNQIVIDHGGGKKTRYAHLSAFNAEKGDKVSKGEQIGKMGSTGWSTGSHLHFEVIIDGKKYNPLNYIK